MRAILSSWTPRSELTTRPRFSDGLILVYFSIRFRLLRIQLLKLSFNIFYTIHTVVQALDLTPLPHLAYLDPI
jgi:hypothetical protein